MSPEQLEDILKNFASRASLLKDRGYRQIWRFEAEGKAYYLKFYPRRGGRLKRMIRGNPAMGEFSRLQQLQKANVPAPRAMNVLMGFGIGGRMGDAVILEGIEPSVSLDQYLSDFKLSAAPVPRHRELVGQVIEIVRQLGRAGLGHSDLHLGNFLLKDEKLYLLDGYAVHGGGLKLDDVMLLGHSVSRFATRSDLLRGWRELGGDRPMPLVNRVSPRLWRKFVERAAGENDWFGEIACGEWRGHYFKTAKFARRWAAASAMSVSDQDWQVAWPKLWEEIQSQQLEAMKTSRSGDVWAGEVSVGGKLVGVVVKRPYKRYWYRYINEIGRGSRAWRAWIKAWKLVGRNIPTAWPMLVVEKRTLGYVTDSVVVFERLAGPTLAAVELDAMDEQERQMLFRRAGRMLRQIDAMGLSHFDAKASNWIVCFDEVLGPRPVLIDVDGVRSRRWVALGIERLLRSMREHPQYTPADSLALCQGYAPYSPMMIRQD